MFSLVSVAFTSVDCLCICHSWNWNSQLFLFLLRMNDKQICFFFSKQSLHFVMLLCTRIFDHCAVNDAVC